ncbi:hypothetical protein LQ327_15640 [Actinomycetospora endophytica]|uniref:Uncharacterized protein n=1 Tax=Actinomycetospora endophytica TaxID=2291215 RepID=A0ABS8P964_9PSEU|nr:hypothetical protein [Actinomycetospora endophytica]MCD2194804.1 hypothetical protein [Actinomycetospora endophytica]
MSGVNGSAARALSVVRVLIGLSTWVAPVRASRVFGLDVSTEASAPLWLRLGGTRDVALATLPHAGDDDARRRGLRTGQACDGADLLAVLLAWRAGRMPAGSAAIFGAASTACLVLGSVALDDHAHLGGR